MSDTPETDAEHAQFPMGGFTLDFARKLERERDRLAVALDVCLREMLDVIYACNEEIVDANDTFHQAIKLGQKTLDDVKGGSDERR
jgi:hypothetical protein